MGEVGESGVRAKGLTLAAARGAQVVSPAEGRIAFAGPFRSYTGIVIIDHDNGWATLLTGLDRLSVRPGMKVLQGSPIGRAAGGEPRVGVELRHRSAPVDITPLLSAG
jgi:septal ring factor EnvC (AmiA/AmiB activator)